MQSKLTFALLASSLAVGSLAAPQVTATPPASGATTVDGIVVPSSIISVVYADVTSIIGEVPSSVLAAIATISGLPTDEAGIISAVSEFEAGATPAWFSALTEVVPTSVQTSIINAAESVIETLVPLVSELDTLTSTVSSGTSLSTATSTSTAAITAAPGGNSTIPATNSSSSSITLSTSATPTPQSPTSGAAGVGKMTVASMLALSGVLGLVVLL